MAFVKIVPPAEATGLMKTQYENTRSGMGVDEYARLLQAWSLQPEVAAAWLTAQRVAREATGLDPTEWEIMECRLMYVTRSRYVLVNHLFILARVSGFSHDQLKEYVQEWEGSGLSPRMKAVLAFADRLATESYRTARADVDALRANGFDDGQVVALVFAIGSLVQNGILSNGLGVELDEFSREYRDIADW